MRHPSEIWAKFVELKLPLDKWGWFLGTCFAHDQDAELCKILEEFDKEAKNE